MGDLAKAPAALGGVQAKMRDFAKVPAALGEFQAGLGINTKLSQAYRNKEALLQGNKLMENQKKMADFLAQLQGPAPTKIITKSAIDPKYDLETTLVPKKFPAGGWQNPVTGEKIKTQDSSSLFRIGSVPRLNGGRRGERW